MADHFNLYMDDPEACKVSVMEPYIGQLFKSFDLVKKYLTEYGNQNNMKFWIRSSHLLTSYKTASAKKCNPNLKYMSMKFACVYGGERMRYRGSGLRRTRTTIRNCNCPCKVVAVVGKDGNHVRLSTVILEHNHELKDPKIVKKNYKLRNVNKEDKDETDECENEIASNHFLIESQEGSESIEEGIQTFRLDSLCRLCLHSSSELSHIFNPDSPVDGTILSLKIMGCASIDLDLNDGLPRSICKNCLDLVDIAYNFRTQCENSDSVLRKMLDEDEEEYVHELDVNVTVREEFKKDQKERENIIENNENLAVNFVETENTTQGDENITQDNTTQNQEDMFQNLDSTEQETPLNHPLIQMNENEDDIQLLSHYYRCQVCGAILSTWNSMIDHIPSHKLLSLACETCSNTYTVRDKLYDVIKHVVGDSLHIQQQDGVCEVDASHDSLACKSCQTLHTSLAFTFFKPKIPKPSNQDAVQIYLHDLKTDKKLVSHQNSENVERSHLCPHCGKVFKSKERLVSHQNSHNGLKPHLCPQCGKGFADRKNMHQHLSTVHLKKAKHECPICQKKFYVPNKLRSHMTVHDGVKPFQCDICHRSFRLNMNMLKHMKTHSLNRPHQCSQCNASFIDKNMLRRHSYVHGGLRPYSCYICGHRFAVKFRLKKHLEKNNCQNNEDLEELQLSWLQNDGSIKKEEVREDGETVELYMDPTGHGSDQEREEGELVQFYMDTTGSVPQNKVNEPLVRLYLDPEREKDDGQLVQLYIDPTEPVSKHVREDVQLAGFYINATDVL